MSFTLRQIEAQHWHHCYECRCCDEDGSLTQPCDVVKLARALDELLPAAHRAQGLCSSGETHNFCNDWDERDAREYAEAINQAERVLEEVAGE